MHFQYYCAVAMGALGARCIGTWTVLVASANRSGMDAMVTEYG